MTKVSVIIPCYNQERFLSEAISSTIGNFSDFEVVVINDGSTNEKAEEKINKICDNFKNINIKVIHQENQGVCHARNNAILHACGEYILPLDADDLIENEYLQQASEILEKFPDIGIVYCNAEYFGEKNGLWNLAKATKFNMLIQNRIFNSSMFRKSDWEKVGGYNPNMVEGCEDWDFWLSLMECGLKIHKMKPNFYKHRELKKSRTSNALIPINYYNIRKQIIKNHKNLYLKYNILALIPMAARIIKEFLCQR